MFYFGFCTRFGGIYTKIGLPLTPSAECSPAQTSTLGLIQEPYVYGGRICRITKHDTLVYCKDHDVPSAALLVRSSINFLPIPQFITRDLVAVEAELPTSQGTEAVIIASAYFHREENSAPPEAVKALANFCQKRRILVATPMSITCCGAAVPRTKEASLFMIICQLIVLTF